MKFSKIAIVLIAATALFFSCQKDNQPQPSEPKTEVTPNAEPQAVVDWAGTYYGVLPAASCPGIKTLITLKDGNAFEKTEYYLSSNDTPESTYGVFTWSEDKSIITFGERSYKVVANQLKALDADNKVITNELADDYTLTKIDLAPIEGLSDGYLQNKYTGDDKIEYTLNLNPKSKSSIALLKYGESVKPLMQIESYANGGEYAGNEATLTIKGNKSNLTIEKKKVKLTVKK